MDDTVIELLDVSKSYSLESRPLHRLWQQLRGHVPQTRQFQALRHVNLRVRRGEVLGLIGRNGAGKSTLLQVVCGVLEPSQGVRHVRGRVAALLELGAGFNPELTGRENVRLNGPLLGLTPAQIDARLPGIVDFAGIGDFIDQPVRSYSSGMFVRLAFSMATSVEPDILVIDEALSVGDGAFAHKSFERIMALKDRGATILFCSHSMFQIEALCTRALWIEAGEVRYDGPAHRATVEYNEWLMRQEHGEHKGGLLNARFDSPQASITRVTLHGAAAAGPLRSGEHDLVVEVDLQVDPSAALPSLGIVISGGDGRAVTSAGNWLDGVPLRRRDDGRVRARLTLPRMPLLKGRYTVSVYVLCDRAINLWASAEHAASFDVVQDHLEQGVVSLPRHWDTEVLP